MASDPRKGQPTRTRKLFARRADAGPMAIPQRKVSAKSKTNHFFAASQVRIAKGPSVSGNDAHGGWNSSHARWKITHARWNVPHGSWRIAHVGWKIAHAGWKTAHARWKTTHAGWNVPHAGWKITHASWNVPHASWKITYSSWKIAHASWSIANARWKPSFCFKSMIFSHSSVTSRPLARRAAKLRASVSPFPPDF